MDWNNYLGEIRLGDTLYAVRHTFIWDDDNEIIKKVKVINCKDCHDGWKSIQIEGSVGSIYISPYVRKNKEINAGNYMYFVNEQSALNYARTKLAEFRKKIERKEHAVWHVI